MRLQWARMRRFVKRRRLRAIGVRIFALRETTGAYMRQDLDRLYDLLLNAKRTTIDACHQQRVHRRQPANPGTRRPFKFQLRSSSISSGPDP